MPKNRDTPALFELVRSTGIKRSSSSARENPLIPEKTPLSSKKQGKSNPSHTTSTSPTTTAEEPATLNQSIRLPLGYIFVACAAVILLLVIAYSVGYARGNNASKAEKAGFLNNSNSTESTESTTSNNTTTSPPMDNQAASTTSHNNANPDLSKGNRNLSNPTPTTDRTTDTRRKGLNYIFVERFSPEEADQVADYLAGQGIDAMVLPANNRLRQVVLRQGFEGWSSNRQGQALLAKIKALGREWKSQHGGTKNFDQAYGNKFRG